MRLKENGVELSREAMRLVESLALKHGKTDSEAASATARLGS
jgi:hypothetical protein